MSAMSSPPSATTPTAAPAAKACCPKPLRCPTTAYSAELQRVASGVAGLIVPWNFPMVTTSWKIAPALAAGVTVVLKPSEVTPLAEIALFEILHEAGLPAGVANLVYGAGPVGAASSRISGISKISFTGSNATGQRIMLACGRTAAARHAGTRRQVGADRARRCRSQDRRRPRRARAPSSTPGRCARRRRASSSPKRLYDEFVERLAAAATGAARRRPG